MGNALDLGRLDWWEWASLIIIGGALVVSLLVVWAQRGDDKGDDPGDWQ